MAKIAIEINCKATTCNNCAHLSYHEMMGFACKIFCKPVKSKGSSFYRLSECKQAEVDVENE